MAGYILLDGCVEMEGVREHAEEMPVQFGTTYKNDRLSIIAFNQGGCDYTIVDALDFIKWLKKNHPELLSEIDL